MRSIQVASTHSLSRSGTWWLGQSPMAIGTSMNARLHDAIQVVSIHGVPRSGTSWLGQVFNSHPRVAYRQQPLFAYRFKDRINLHSSQEEICSFLKELLDVEDDDFILDKREAYQGLLPVFEKAGRPSHLVMKMVRYHHLLEKLMRDTPEIRIIGIVRHPCAVINSWLQAPKEFGAGWDPLAEWRHAPKKNEGRVEEFNGFEKWKEVASLFLKLEEACRDRFYLVRYEDLVVHAAQETRELFDFVGLEMHRQVLEFLHASQSQHCEDPYSVFKHPRVKDRWRVELDPTILDEILREVEGTALARFLA